MNKVILLKFKCVFSILLLLACFNQSLSAQELYKIKEIKVSGNDRIESSTVLYLIGSKPGQNLDLNQVRRDIKSLYKSGFFDNIVVYYKKSGSEVVLIYEVKERPMIAEILISGSEVIPQTSLMDEVTVETGTLYDPVKTKESANKIEAKYLDRGYNFAIVTPKLTPTRPGSAALLFSIDEGTKVYIDKIRFHGNKHFMAGTRFWGLRSIMKDNREHWWMSWATSSGKLKEDLLHDDLELISEFYKNRGYLEVVVGEPKIVMTKPHRGLFGKKLKRKVTIDIPITEGEIYHIGKVDAEVGDKDVFSEDVVMDVIRATRLEKYQKFFGRSAFFKAGPRFEAGKPYSYALEKEVKTQLSDLYGLKGYIYAFIDIRKSIDEETKTVDLHFVISEGKQAFLHRLEFKGNNRTRDRVLRRNFSVIEGGVFNTTKLKDSIARIQYLGYIDEVKPEVNPLVDMTQVDVDISVNDSKQTEIQLAGGYSAYERFYGMLGLSEHNLFGRGQDFSFSTTLGKRRQTFRVTFTDEWIYDRPYYGSVSIWNSIRDYDYSKNKSRGGSLTAGRSLGYNFSTRLGYKWEVNTVYDIASDASTDITDRSGNQVTSSMTAALIYDTLDNRRDPTRGMYSSLTYEYAGVVFGGDNDFYKAGLTCSYFKPLPKNLTFALKGQVDYGNGLQGDDLPFYERYLLGGPSSMRGYRERSVGPWDEFGQNLGGNKDLRLSAEIHIPIAGPLKTVLFFDAADSYAVEDHIDIRTLRPSVGFEVRFFVPGFWIPLRFIWGYNLDPLEGEKKNDFQFAMGTFF